MNGYNLAGAMMNTISKTILSNLTANLITTKLTTKADTALADAKSKSVSDQDAKPAIAVFAEDTISISKDGMTGVLKSDGRDELGALLKGKTIADQANASLQKIQTYLGALKNNLATMADDTLSEEARSQYQSQYQAIVNEIQNEVKNGGPLLNSTDGISISINSGQSKINIPGYPLGQLIDANLGSTPVTSEQSIATLIGGFSTAMNGIDSAAMDMGIGNGRINDQIAFLKNKLAAITPPEVKEKEIKTGMTKEGADTKSAVKVAIAGADQITSALGKLRGVASILADENLTEQARADYQRLYVSLRKETFDFLQGSNDSGFNFLTNNQQTSVTYNQKGASVNIPGFDLSVQFEKLLPAQLGSPNDISSFFGNINQVTQQLSNSQSQLQEILKVLSGIGGR